MSSCQLGRSFLSGYPLPSYADILSTEISLGSKPKMLRLYLQLLFGWLTTATVLDFGFPGAVGNETQEVLAKREPDDLCPALYPASGPISFVSL